MYTKLEVALWYVGTPILDQCSGWEFTNETREVANDAGELFSFHQDGTDERGKGKGVLQWCVGV